LRTFSQKTKVKLAEHVKQIVLTPKESDRGTVYEVAEHGNYYRNRSV